MSNQIFFPGNINTQYKPSSIIFNPNGSVYFENGLPCRCKLIIFDEELNQKRILDYFNNPKLKNVELKYLSKQNAEYLVGFKVEGDNLIVIPIQTYEI